MNACHDTVWPFFYNATIFIFHATIENLESIFMCIKMQLNLVRNIIIFLFETNFLEGNRKGFDLAELQQKFDQRGIAKNKVSRYC